MISINYIKIKMVSYLYNTNPYSWKNSLSMEMGLWWNANLSRQRKKKYTYTNFVSDLTSEDTMSSMQIVVPNFSRLPQTWDATYIDFCLEQLTSTDHRKSNKLTSEDLIIKLALSWMFVQIKIILCFLWWYSKGLSLFWMPNCCKIRRSFIWSGGQSPSEP